jgi:hypothetical protein
LRHHLRYRSRWTILALTLRRLLSLLTEDALEHRVLSYAAQEIAQVRLLYSGGGRALR